MSRRFLSDIRVVDLSQYLPGPFATQMLADLGALVVKVEPPTGDPMRRINLVDCDGMSPAYKLVNAGKTIVRLDLKEAGDRRAFEQLIAHADILLESYRPGTLDRLGIGRARLTELKPDLIHVALSGWGQTGPYRLRAGHDLNYMALGGGLAGSGTAGTPVIAHPPTADHATAQQAVLAVLAALFDRQRTGQGAYLDVSLMETVLGWQSWSMTLARRGMAPARGGDLLNGGAAFYQIYRTADDRFISLGAIEEKFWATFCSTLDQPDWIARHSDPLPQTTLIADVAALIGSRPLADWSERFAGVDCCLEPVLDPTEVPAHPHVEARGQVVETAGPNPLTQVLLGLRIDDAPPPDRIPLRETDIETLLQDW
jgi:alpha-methylacyl-CoA racemase